MGEYKYVLYEKDGAIATITLNRPERLNAFDFPGQGGICDDFFSALEEAEVDDEVKVVIIKGAGRAFCAGHDLSTVGYIYGMSDRPTDKRPGQRIRLKVDRNWLWAHHMRLMFHPKITIAQVHGYCIGEGLMITEECDLAIASEDALLGHTEQRLGFAGCGISTVLPLILSVGLKRARWMLLTGKQISGKEAAEIGLVNKAVPPDKLDETVRKLAEALVLYPADGIAIGKAMTNIVYDILGIPSSFSTGYVGHTLFTNLRYQPGEWIFFKERRDKGVKAAFHERDKIFEEKLKDL